MDFFSSLARLSWRVLHSLVAHFPYLLTFGEGRRVAKRQLSEQDIGKEIQSSTATLGTNATERVAKILKRPRPAIMFFSRSKKFLHGELFQRMPSNFVQTMLLGGTDGYEALVFLPPISIKHYASDFAGCARRNEPPSAKMRGNTSVGLTHRRFP